MGLKNTKQNGMSLIEVMLYISISTIIMTSLSYFMFTVIKSRVKSETITEIEYQGNQIIYLVTESIRNSESVTSPAPQILDDSITINTYQSETNPTQFYLDEGKLFLKEGISDPIQISSDRTIVTKFDIINLSDSRIFRIEVEVTHRNPENKIEYNFTETFKGSAAVKNENI